MKKIIIALGVMLPALYVSASTNINSRSETVIAKLEVLNSLGRRCDAELQVRGKKGASTDTCSKFLKNITGKYFSNIVTECTELNNHYSKVSSEVKKNGVNSYSESQIMPLLKTMKLIKKACFPESIKNNYKYISSVPNKMSAIMSME